MDPLALVHLVDTCSAPGVRKPLVLAVAKAESGGYRFVIHDNTTNRVYRPSSPGEALRILNILRKHSLDVGLMQINTKAHRMEPQDLSPCRNIRKGSEILSRDIHREGEGSEKKALCLYHTGKQGPCGTYLARVVGFLNERKRKSLVNSDNGRSAQRRNLKKERGEEKIDLTVEASTMASQDPENVELPVTDAAVDSFLVK